MMNFKKMKIKPEKKNKFHIEGTTRVKAYRSGIDGSGEMYI